MKYAQILLFASMALVTMILAAIQVGSNGVLVIGSTVASAAPQATAVLHTVTITIAEAPIRPSTSIETVTVTSSSSSTVVPFSIYQNTTYPHTTYDVWSTVCLGPERNESDAIHSAWFSCLRTHYYTVDHPPNGCDRMAHNPFAAILTAFLG